MNDHRFDQRRDLVLESIASGLSKKLTDAHSVPDAITAYQEWLSEEMNARAEDARLLITKVYGRHFSISIERLDKRQHDHVADCVWIPVEEVWRATAMMARAKIIASLAPAESGSTDHREGEML